MIDRQPLFVVMEDVPVFFAKKLTICIRGRLNIINFFRLLFSMRALFLELLTWHDRIEDIEITILRSKFKRDCYFYSSSNIDIFLFHIKIFSLSFFFILFAIQFSVFGSIFS